MEAMVWVAEEEIWTADMEVDRWEEEVAAEVVEDVAAVEEVTKLNHVICI